MSTTSITLYQVSPSAVKLAEDNWSILVDRPTEKGGGGTGLMGGQYLLIGVAGCFCSTLFAAAQSRGITIEGLEITITATLSTDLPKRFVNMELLTSYSSCSQEDEFEKLLKIAEQGCISVNTVKNGLTVHVRKQS